MLCPELSNVSMGSAAETFVKYKLQRWGETVVRVEQDNYFDLLVLRDKPIRVQVKGTKRLFSNETSYQFKLRCGTDKRPYNKGSFDLFALVAMDIEAVIFHPHATQQTLRKQSHLFGPGQGYKTWKENLAKLSSQES